METLVAKAEFAAKILEKLENMQLVELVETRESDFGTVQGPSPAVMRAYNEALAEAAREVIKLLEEEKQ